MTEIPFLLFTEASGTLVLFACKGMVNVVAWIGRIHRLLDISAGVIAAARCLSLRSYIRHDSLLEGLILLVERPQVHGPNVQTP
jgi:hypothetical protein